MPACLRTARHKSRYATTLAAGGSNPDKSVGPILAAALVPAGVIALAAFGVWHIARKRRMDVAMVHILFPREQDKEADPGVAGDPAGLDPQQPGQLGTTSMPVLSAQQPASPRGQGAGAFGSAFAPGAMGQFGPGGVPLQRRSSGGGAAMRLGSGTGLASAASGPAGYGALGIPGPSKRLSNSSASRPVKLAGDPMALARRPSQQSIGGGVQTDGPAVDVGSIDFSLGADRDDLTVSSSTRV